MPTILQTVYEERTKELKILKPNKDKDQHIINKLLK